MTATVIAPSYTHAHMGSPGWHLQALAGRGGGGGAATGAATGAVGFA